jgi:hypothetical protein
VAQTLLPDGNVFLGSWTDPGGGTFNIWENIDDTGNDASYIRSGSNPTGAAGDRYQCTTSDPSGSPPTGSVTVRRFVRYAKSGGKSATLSASIVANSGSSTYFVGTLAGLTTSFVTDDQSASLTMNSYNDASLRFLPSTSGGGSGTTILVSESFMEVPDGGPATQNIAPSGIATAEAFGTAVLTTGAVTVSPTGVGSAEAFGTAVVAQPPPSQTITVTAGIATAEALGSPTVTVGAVTLAPSGITSTEAFGTTTVTTGPVSLTVTGIPTAEAFGTATIGAGAPAQDVLPTGIGSAEAFGATTVTPGPVQITVTGVGSAEAFGTTVLAPGSVTLSPAGIASAEAVGIPTVTTTRVGTTTRLFFGNTSVPGATPSDRSSVWGAGNAATWRKLFPNDYINDGGVSNQSTSETVGAPVNVFTRGFVLENLPPQVIDGTMSVVLRTSETSNLVDASLQVVARVMSADGTVERGVLYGGHSEALNSTAGALGQEFSTTASTRIINAVPLSPVTVQDGDMLVVEMGWRSHGSDTTSRTAALQLGYSSDDLDFALTAGLTQSDNPWVEFSELATRQTVAPPAIPGADGALSWEFDSADELEHWYSNNGTLSYDSTTAPPGGVGSAKLVSSLTSWRIGVEPPENDFPLTPAVAETDWEVSFWAKADVSYPNADADAYFGGFSTQASLSNITLNTDWTEYTFPVAIDVLSDGGVLNGFSNFELRFDSASSALPTVWVSRLRLRPVQNLQMGTPTLTVIGPQDVLPTGIPSTEAFGTPVVGFTQTLVASGIASAEVFGLPVLTGGPATLQPVGISTEEDVGRPRVRLTHKRVLRPPTVEDTYVDIHGRSNPWGVELNAGITLLKIDGVYHQVRWPTDDDIAAATAVYRGGFDHEVDDAEVADLTAAGYGAYVQLIPA